jgi:hypothetical protein
MAKTGVVKMIICDTNIYPNRDIYYKIMDRLLRDSKKLKIKCIINGQNQRQITDSSESIIDLQSSSRLQKICKPRLRLKIFKTLRTFNIRSRLTFQTLGVQKQQSKKRYPQRIMDKPMIDDDEICDIMINLSLNEANKCEQIKISSENMSIDLPEDMIQLYSQMFSLHLK